MEYLLETVKKEYGVLISRIEKLNIGFDRHTTIYKLFSQTNEIYFLKIRSDDFNECRIQQVSATPEEEANASAGVRNRKHFIGVELIPAIILFSCLWLVKFPRCLMKNVTEKGKCLK